MRASIVSVFVLSLVLTVNISTGQTIDISQDAVCEDLSGEKASLLEVAGNVP